MSEKEIFTETCKIKNLLLNTEYIPFNKLKNKSILITGGTGLVGSAFTKILLVANEEFKLDAKIYLLVRNAAKAESIFGKQNNLFFVSGSLDNIPEMNFDIDYIMHGASPTASKYFAEHPVETVKTAVGGTIGLLDLAKDKSVEGFVYLSSMEVYGERHDEEPVKENEDLLTQPLRVRSCYPQSKLLCENLCIDYFEEYSLPCKIVRLAQTFGPGIPKDDNRVFAQFARSAIEKRDIILQTPGTTKQCYVYTLDAALAIWAILLSGESGQAYNVANPATYCSIKEMAEMVADEIADNSISVKIVISEDAAKKYPPAHKWNLSADKLLALGWRPTKNLKEMYIELVDCLK